VTASNDCTVIEIRPDAFRAYIQEQPQALSVIAAAAASRQAELNAAKDSIHAPVETPASMLQKMRKFLGLR